MKRFLILMVVVIIACNNIQEQGFTNKAEAKNELVNGLKEGRWMEYLDSNLIFSTDYSAPYYSLSTYLSGKRIGITHVYNKNGKLKCEEPYTDGNANGVEKFYYETGKLKGEVPFTGVKKMG